MSWRLLLLSSVVCPVCTARRISPGSLLFKGSTDGEDGEGSLLRSEQRREAKPSVVFGTDIGGVLCMNVEDIEMSVGDASNWWLKRGWVVKGALDAVRSIVAHVGQSNSFVIATVSTEMETQKKEWLEKIKFWEYTGIPKENVRWVPEEEDKGVVAKELGITHFVDDRPDCLMHIYSSARKRFMTLSGRGQLFHLKGSGMDADVADEPGLPVWPDGLDRPACIVAAADWKDVLKGLNFGPWSNWTEATLSLELHKYELWSFSMLEQRDDEENSNEHDENDKQD